MIFLSSKRGRMDPLRLMGQKMSAKLNLEQALAAGAIYYSSEWKWEGRGALPKLLN